MFQQSMIQGQRPEAAKGWRKEHWKVWLLPALGQTVFQARHRHCLIKASATGTRAHCRGLSCESRRLAHLVNGRIRSWSQSPALLALPDSCLHSPSRYPGYHEPRWQPPRFSDVIGALLR